MLQRNCILQRLHHRTRSRAPWYRKHPSKVNCQRRCLIILLDRTFHILRRCRRLLRTSGVPQTLKPLALYQSYLTAIENRASHDKMDPSLRGLRLHGRASFKQLFKISNGTRVKDHHCEYFEAPTHCTYIT